MSTFFMFNTSFSNFGIVIQQNINMTSISNSFSVLFGFPLRFHSLNVSFVNVDQVNGIGGITATGLGNAFLDGRLTVGDLGQFLPGTISAPAVSGFYHLSLTAGTISNQGVDYDINQNTLSPLNTEESLTFDNQLRSFDFSATGTAALDLLMNRVSTQANPGSATYVAFNDQEVIANAGNNIVYGYSGPGRADGYTGSNTYRLGGGSDIFLPGDALDGGFVEGSSSQLGSNDQVRVFGGTGNDSIATGDKNDELYGESGNDVLFGGGGNDILVGGSSNDLLYASEGADTLIGGTGADRFIFANGRFIDFEPGITLGEGEISKGFFTGFNISTDGVPNIVTDFNASQNDLIVVGVDQFTIEDTFGGSGENPAAFIFFPNSGTGGAPVWQFNVFNDRSQDNYAFTGSAALTLDNVLIQAESFAYVSFPPTLNLATGVLDQLENSRDGSYEIVYGGGGLFGTNIGFSFPEVQTYRNVSLGRSESATGPIGGQDKFDLSGLGLTTSGVILTDVGIDQQFTLYDFAFFNTDELSNSYVRALNFFQDGSNGDRAIHAEYDHFSEGNSMVVYVDVNGDGDLDTRDDLVFRIDNLLLSPDENEFGSADLAQELTVDQVDDLFILSTSQYNLWFA